MRFVCLVVPTIQEEISNRILKFVHLSFDNSLKINGHSIEFVNINEYGDFIRTAPTAIKISHSESNVSESRNFYTATEEADAYIILTNKYNTEDFMKNVLQHIPSKCFEFKPTALVRYSDGGIEEINCDIFRMELGCIDVKHSSIIENVMEVINENGTTYNSVTKGVVEELLKRLEWWASAAKAKRKEEVTPLHPDKKKGHFFARARTNSEIVPSNETKDCFKNIHVISATDDNKLSRDRPDSFVDQSNYRKKSKSEFDVASYEHLPKMLDSYKSRKAIRQKVDSLISSLIEMRNTISELKKDAADFTLRLNNIGLA